MPNARDVALPRSFFTLRVWLAATGAWMLLAAFVWGRDLMLVGADAASLRPQQLLLMTQSMVVWGFFSPFILTAAQLLEFEPGRRLRSLAGHLAFAALLAVLDALIDLLLAVFTGLDDGTFAQRFYAEVFINTFSYIAVVALGYALVYHRRLGDSRINELELQRQLAQSRLDALAQTLRPHFLFNALNSVAALVRLAENQRALSALVSLSDLLRIVLQTRGEARVTLNEELQFTQRYIAIEQLRFEDRLEPRIEVDAATGQCLVPALILQPLVENAIRHGVEICGHGRVTIRSHASAEWLTLIVGVETRGAVVEARVTGLGIGLDVTRRRLGCLYGEENFSLELLIGNTSSSVSLRIPRQEEAGVGTDTNRRRG